MKKILGIICIVLCGAFVLYLQFSYKPKAKPGTYYQVYLDDKVIGVIKSKDEFYEHVSEQGELIKKQVQEYIDNDNVLEAIDNLINEKIVNTNLKKQYLNYRKQYKELSQYVKTNGSFSSENREKVETLLNSFAPEYLNNVYINEENISNYKGFLSKLEDYFNTTKATYIKYIIENVSDLNLSENDTYYLDIYTKDEELQNVSYIRQLYMEEYIEENEIYVEVEDIYTPLGVRVQKLNSYVADVSTVDEVYRKIIDQKPNTIEGYQFRIKKTPTQTLSYFAAVGGVLVDDYKEITSVADEDVIIYVTSPEVFKEAVEKLEYVFVDEDVLEAYRAGNQKEIETEGSIIADIYVEEDITYKEDNISVSERIFNEPTELSNYLLYGENMDVRTVKATADTSNIEDLTNKYEISVEEFFLSNPKFTSINNIFYIGEELTIAKTDPKINIVVEQYVVEDMPVEYETIEQYDSSINQGMEVVKQNGKDGMNRVGQNVRSVNGTITYVEPVSSVSIVEPRDRIIAIGTKVIPNVGSLSSWGWPTKKGYRISSYFGWRTSPITGGRELHSGIDIAGTGLGSPVYATNNGTIMIKEYKYSYGNYIIIDHNNGYYSTYAHMNGFAKGIKEGATVSRGQIIGYVGSTGYSTGPHLHFEIRTCSRYSCAVNPLPYLRK